MKTEHSTEVRMSIYVFHVFQSLDRKSTTRDWLHKIDGAVIVYSVTDKNSFDIAEVVMDWLKKEKKPNQVIPMVLIGNKCDLEHSR